MRPSPGLVLVLFLVTQISDGLLTYAAVGVLGVVEEGNLILASAMRMAGAGPALLAAKVIAAGCGLVLYVRGLHGTLGVLTGIYLVAAITPWLVVFHHL